MNALSVLVKPVSSRCNIDCKYCFYKDEDCLRGDHSVTAMSEDTLELLVKRLFECATQRVSVVFQGGEPTLAGLDFFKKFIALAEEYNKNNIAVELSLQTNGILLDEGWCRFLNQHNFLVGLSFDGCPRVNDFNRVTYGGEGVSSRVSAAIRMLQKFNVEYNVLMVVTAQSSAYAKECYRYLNDSGVKYLQLIPVLDPYCGEKQGYSLTGAQFGKFLCDIFDLWHADFVRRRELRITYFENIITKLAGGFTPVCSMNGMCCIETVVEADGSVYPCDFYAADEWKLGNIHESDIPSLIFSRRASEFVSGSVHSDGGCAKCPYFGLCMGSCQRYRRGDGAGRHCAGYRIFFRHALPILQNIARSVQV